VTPEPTASVPHTPRAPLGDPAGDHADPPEAGRHPAVADLPDAVPGDSAHEEVATGCSGEHRGVPRRRRRHVRALRLVEVEFRDGRFEPVPGSAVTCRPDLVLLAMGFVGPEKSKLLEASASTTTTRQRGQGRLVRDQRAGVFVAGDMGRGQSLIVWAIAEGRSAAAGVDQY